MGFTFTFTSVMQTSCPRPKTVWRQETPGQGQSSHQEVRPYGHGRSIHCPLSLRLPVAHPRNIEKFMDAHRTRRFPRESDGQDLQIAEHVRACFALADSSPLEAVWLCLYTPGRPDMPQAGFPRRFQGSNGLEVLEGVACTIGRQRNETRSKQNPAFLPAMLAHSNVLSARCWLAAEKPHPRPDTKLV
jgi:hypothetical protein